MIRRFCLVLFLILAGVPAALQAATPDEPTAAPGAVQGLLSSRLDDIRGNLASLVAVVPEMPAQVARAADILARDLQGRSVIGTLVLMAALLGLGLVAEWLFVRTTGRWRSRIAGLPMATVGQRLMATQARLVYGTAEVIAFGLGSIGVFLIFDWPQLLREILLVYLLAVLALRLALALSRFVLAPGTAAFEDMDRFRLLPMSRVAARFWHRRLGLLVGWFAFGYATTVLMDHLGFDVAARRLVAYVLGLGLLAIGVEMVWRQPADASVDGAAVSPRRRTWAWLLSAYFVAIWVLWVTSARPMMWLAIVLIAVPTLRSVGQRVIAQILRPPGSPTESGFASFVSVALERAFRAFLLIGAVLFLANAWQIDLVALASGDTALTRLARGLFSSVVIILLADFAWHIVKTAIDLKLAEAPASTDLQSEAWRRQARLKTILPIFRYVLMVVLASMVVLMVLAALGVDVGPLIAAAGVLGVAIGFGAQTLVRDIIAGIFYLLDDAFRVGEYIQSGNYKGTVESFSLRSVKLRHHRGPIYIVPFGVLGAVQNMSRDWVIDKFMIGVTYDTDLDKVKKIIKQVGKDLLADPELAPNIMETVKFQGLEQFGDFAIQVRMKMMTKPGEQFPIRRRAFAMIKKAFDANGIKFAFPTVQVAGDGATPEAVALAAHQASVKPEAAKP